MQIALVHGSARATAKHESLDGQRLVVVQPLMRDERSSDGPPLLAIDDLGARKGDRVVLTSDGLHARKLTGTDKTPARWSVAGIVDRTT